MSKRKNPPFSEADLVANLTPYTAHADELPTHAEQERPHIVEVIAELQAKSWLDESEAEVLRILAEIDGGELSYPEHAQWYVETSDVRIVLTRRLHGWSGAMTWPEHIHFGHAWTLSLLALEILPYLKKS